MDEKEDSVLTEHIKTSPAPQPDLTLPYCFRSDAPEVNPSVVPEQFRASAAQAAAKETKQRERSEGKTGTIQARLTASGQDAVDVLEHILTDPSVKLQTKHATAIWLLEKLTGKPKQEFEHGASSTLSELFVLLENMQAKAGLTDVTPGEAQPTQLAGTVIDAEFSEAPDGAAAVRTDASHPAVSGSGVSSEVPQESPAARWVRENL